VSDKQEKLRTDERPQTLSLKESVPPATDALTPVHANPRDAANSKTTQPVAAKSTQPVVAKSAQPTTSKTAQPAPATLGEHHATKAHLPDERHVLGKITPIKVPVSQAKDGSGAPSGASRSGMSGAAHADAPEEPKSSRVGTIIFFVVCGLVILGLVGLVWYNNQRAETAKTQYQYNGFDFKETTGGFWVTQVQARGQLYEIPFYFHPEETDFIPTDYDAVKPVYAAPTELYISLDPDAGATPVVAAAEISRLTGNKYNLFNIPTRGALSRPDPTTEIDLPIFDCRNATKERVIIQFVKGKMDAISLGSNPNCIILQYTDGNESKRVADRYAYMLLKIVQ
jgi:hypothetical protein